MLADAVIGGINISLILNILYFGILGVGLIAGLIGIWKGIWKTSFKLIFIGALIVLFIFLTPTISKAVASIDLTSLNRDLTIGGNTIQITTVDETLVNILISTGYVSPTDSATVYEMALALSHSIISFAVFFILMLMIFLFGWFFTAIFYHAIFKFFIPKKVRRKHKVRWLSFFVGAIEGIMVMVMFISPLSSIANVLANNNESIQKLEEKEILTDQQYTDILNVLDAYSNSLLYKTLTFNGTNEGVDTMIINQVMTETVNGQKITILNEVDSILSIVGPLADVIKVATDESGRPIVEQTSLYSGEVVNIVLTFIETSNLIMTLLPAIVDIGLNYASGQITNMDLSGIDLSNVNWNDGEISAINQCYQSLYDSGLITYFTTENAELDFSDENVELYKTALKTLGDTDIFESLLPTVLNIANTELAKSGFNLLGGDISPFVSMDWGQELGDILVLANNLSSALGIDINAMIKDPQGLDYLTLITDSLKDPEKSTSLKNAILGDTEEKGLLDLQLFGEDRIAIKDLIKEALAANAQISEVINPDDINNSVDDMTIDQWKDEVGIILDVLPLILDNPNLDVEHPENIDFKNEDTVEDMKKVVDIATDSKLLKDLLPSIVESAMAGSEMQDMDIFGLKVSDFNFRVEDLKDEMTRILDILPTILDMSELVNDGGDTTNILDRIDLEDLKSILVVAVSSQIINPSMTLDGTSNVVDNINLEKLLRGIFEQDSMKDIGVVLPNDFSNIKWLDQTSDSTTTPGEISRLISALNVIKEKAGFLLENPENFQLTDLDSSIIVDLLDAIGESELLNSSISSILNKQVSPTLSQIGVSVDFNVVENWGVEGRYLGALIDSLNDLSDAEGNLDLENIDWLNLEADKLNSLMTAFASTSLAGVSRNDSGYYVDNLGNLIYSLIGDNQDISNLVGDVEYYLFSSVDPSTGTSVGWSWIEETAEVEITLADGETKVTRTITSVGEVKNLVDIVSKLSTLGFDTITSNTLDGADLKDVLYSINDSNVLNPMIGQLISNIVSDIDPISIGETSIDFKDINTEGLVKGDKAYIESQIDALLVVYDYLKVDDEGNNIINSLTDISSLTDTALDTLNTLLDSLLDVDMLAKAKTGATYSIYERLISAMLNQAGIDTLVTDIDDKAQAKVAMMNIIHNNYGGDSALGKSENSKLINVLRNLEGLDYSNLTDVTAINVQTLENIMKSMNESAILHGALPGFLDEIISTSGIDALLSAPLTDGGTPIVIHPLETRVHLSTSARDVAYWDNEIEQIVQLFGAVRNPDGSLKDLSGMTISEDSNLISILGPIDSMAMFEDSKEYLLYNIMNTTGSLMDNIRPLDVEGENGHAARIKSLIFWNGHTYADLDYQCQILESFVSIAQQNSGTSDLTDTNNKDLPFTLVMGTMKYFNETSGEKFVRSGLISEIMTNVIYNSLITSLDIEATSDSYTQLTSLFYDTTNPYNILNIVEGRGMRGLIGLMEANGTSDMEVFKSAINSYMPYLGPTVIDNSLATFDEATNPGYNKLLMKTYTTSYSETLRAHNSQLALILFNAYANKISFTLSITVMGQTISRAYTLAEIAAMAGIDTEANTFTFEALGDQIVATIDSLQNPTI